MSLIMAEVNQRTQLAGKNRFEMLLFGLHGDQRFGINVFKVREVIPAPPVRRHPGAHRFVRGVAHIRGLTIPIIDLAVALGRPPADRAGFVIVTEFNRSVQGFLVDMVERIVNLNWEDVLPPLEGHGRTGFLTAVARVDDELLEVLDVEKVLAEVVGDHAIVSDALRHGAEATLGADARIFVVDDSSVARSQIRRALEQVGMQCTFAADGRTALDELQRWAQEGVLDARVHLVLSDIEMPQMDGYTLTTMIRRDPRLEHLKVMLHSSLSGGFNQAMVDRVGADYWLPKFSSDELVSRILEALATARPEVA
jgi:two-component system chemotaxis response regulator CheV